MGFRAGLYDIVGKDQVRSVNLSIWCNPRVNEEGAFIHKSRVSACSFFIGRVSNYDVELCG